MAALTRRAEYFNTLLDAVNGVIAALAMDDLEKAAEAGKRLGTTPEMERMCNHMGAATPGFTERALAFHKTADGIAAAAERGDPKGVLRALNGTLTTCVSCHAEYRQEIVEREEWQRITGQDAPAHKH